MVNDKVNDVVNVMVNRLKGFRHEQRLLEFRVIASYLTILSLVQFKEVVVPYLGVF